jgi:hypothetical protein
MCVSGWRRRNTCWATRHLGWDILDNHDVDVEEMRVRRTLQEAGVPVSLNLLFDYKAGIDSLGDETRLRWAVDGPSISVFRGWGSGR